MGQLIRQVFEFKREFEVNHYVDDKPTHLLSMVEARVFLHMNFEGNTFYLDMNEAFSASLNLVLFPSVNCFGNFADNTSAVIEYYNWLGDIVIFAKGQFEEPEPVETLDMGCEVGIPNKITPLNIDISKFKGKKKSIKKSKKKK